MKKKLFAALAAAMLLCCTLAAPVSAAETYQMGDVNMDGEVAVDDAILTLTEYVEIVIGIREEGILTPEQRALAQVIPVEYLPKEASGPDDTNIFLEYALVTLIYSTQCLAYPELAEQGIWSWYLQEFIA